MVAMWGLGPHMEAMSQPFKLPNEGKSQGSSFLQVAGKPRWGSSADSAKTDFVIRMIYSRVDVVIHLCTFTTHYDSIRQNDHYLNSDPLLWLIGKANELEIVVDDTKCLAWIDSRALLSTITVAFAQQLALEIHCLHKILKDEAMGGGDIL